MDDEQRLVLRAQAGDQDAFEALLRRYEAPLFRHIYRMVGHEDGSYEALQETYLVVIKNIRKLRSRESFRPWIYGVATRVCLKARSKRARRREDYTDVVERADPRPLPELEVATEEQREAIMDRVKELSPKLRSVVLLHFYEGLTLREVAAALEISLGTAKSRLSAGLAQLRLVWEGMA